MKERPIIFSASMIRAILDGQKTQTRLIIKPQPPHGCEYSINSNGTHALCHSSGPIDNKTRWVPPTPKSTDHRLPCPYGSPGNRLWVREAFAAGLCTKEPYAYRATHKPSDLEEGWNEPIKWTPSIHMPRSASRIDLKITSIRIQRLQDISELEANAEGAKQAVKYADGHITAARRIVDRELHARSFVVGFEGLWQQIHGPGSWDENPWVWVIEFRIIA